MTVGKISWEGKIICIQPRIKLTRSFDERYHSYLGYILFIAGTFSGDNRQFSISISKAAQEKNSFRIGDLVSGQGVLVADPKNESADLYRASKLKILSREDKDDSEYPFGISTALPLEVYRERGHLRLATQTYDKNCINCIWGCRMPVEMIIDHWNPSKKRYRFETFCYGPKSCKDYRSGPTRKVPGRKGMSYEEEDWVDEELTSHREPDD